MSDNEAELAYVNAIPVPLSEARITEAVDYATAEFHTFECPECEFMSVQKAAFQGGRWCPLCAGDCGHDVRMNRRATLLTDVVSVGATDARKSA